MSRFRYVGASLVTKELVFTMNAEIIREACSFTYGIHFYDFGDLK